MALPTVHDASTVAVLCQGLAVRLAMAGADRVRCEVGPSQAVDVGTVDALARVVLTAKRSGAMVSVRGAAVDLRGLLALVGLAEVVACEDDAPG